MEVEAFSNAENRVCTHLLESKHDPYARCSFRIEKNRWMNKCAFFFVFARPGSRKTMIATWVCVGMFVTLYPFLRSVLIEYRESTFIRVSTCLISSPNQGLPCRPCGGAVCTLIMLNSAKIQRRAVAPIVCLCPTVIFLHVKTSNRTPHRSVHSDVACNIHSSHLWFLAARSCSCLQQDGNCCPFSRSPVRVCVCFRSARHRPSYW